MGDPFFQPVCGLDLPRFAGIPTFMRLSHVALEDPRLGEVQIGLIGVPWDSGTTNRACPPHGPRQLRDLSTMIRAQNGITGVRPVEAANLAAQPGRSDGQHGADYRLLCQGDGGGDPAAYGGGDHLKTLPILRDGEKKTPLGMIHFDSHTDLFDGYFGGTKYTHGTPFRRALEEGLLDPKRVCMIGIRGTTYDNEDRDFADSVDIRVIPIQEFHGRGVTDVMAGAGAIAGDGDTYISYDIDFVDPAFAPGTGTPEIGGPNSFQALEVVRNLAGVCIVGADVVEVSPPFDPSGNTAFLGASILFELPCVMAPAL